jgi:hypothetical protein
MSGMEREKGEGREIEMRSCLQIALVERCIAMLDFDQAEVNRPSDGMCKRKSSVVRHRLYPDSMTLEALRNVFTCVLTEEALCVARSESSQPYVALRREGAEVRSRESPPMSTAMLNCQIA